MKLGELYDLAKQAYPSLTKRMFTQFYNMAMEQISEQARISVVEAAYTDDSYDAISIAEIVRIENVTTETPYAWKVVDDALVFYDENKNVVVPDEMHIKYWKRVLNANHPPEYYTHASAGTISTVSTGAITMSVETDVDKQLVLLEDMVASDLGSSTLVSLIPAYSIIMVSASKAFIYLYDSTNLNVRTQMTVLGNNTNIDYYLFSNTWEEQDDGFADEVGLCAMYMATSMLAEFTAENSDTATFSVKRAQQYLSQLRKKYNTSLTWNRFTQVGF